MQNIIHSLLEKYHCTIMLPVFIVMGIVMGMFYFLIPLLAALAFAIFTALTAKTDTHKRIGVFITLALLSGVFAGMVLSVEPWVMLGMFVIAGAIFFSVRFPSWVATWLIIMILITSASAVAFPTLIIPTTLIACMGGLATYLMCQEKAAISKAL